MAELLPEREGRMPCKYCQSPFSEQVVSQGQILSQQEGGWVVGGQNTLANSANHSAARLHSAPCGKGACNGSGYCIPVSPLPMKFPVLFF